MERTPIWLVGGALLLAALCAAILSGGGARARADGPPDVLPDLVADPPAHPSLNYYAYPDGSHDLLLRFDGYVHNAGLGALDIRAARSDPAQPMPPLQRVYRTDGSFHDDPMPANAQLFYSNADGHHHWHFQNVARYSLWSPDRGSMVAPAMKVGFCFEDSEHVDTTIGPSSPVYSDANGRHFCQKNKPDALSLFEGVSAGWRDLYAHNLALQWVVVSDVQPGAYRLREDMDPTGVIRESNEKNTPAWSADTFRIPGYAARAVSASSTPQNQSQSVKLRATTFGSPGTMRFRIVSPPRHGKLNVTAGTDFSKESVKYTPDHGYRGLDRFVYAAVDSSSPYPIHPGAATVALTVGVKRAARVMLERAPASVQAGNGVQLHAKVVRDNGPVTWSVDGAHGGSTRAGTITASGFYRAPAGKPAAGRVTIIARSASGASDRRVVKIVWSAPPGPSPGAAGPRFSRRVLVSTASAPAGRLVAASISPWHAGVVSIRARVGGKGLGSCSAKTPKGTRFTCRLYVPGGIKLRDLRIAAEIVRHHRVVARVHRAGV